MPAGSVVLWGCSPAKQLKGRGRMYQKIIAIVAWDLEQWACHSFAVPTP